MALRPVTRSAPCADTGKVQAGSEHAGPRRPGRARCALSGLLLWLFASPLVGADREHPEETLLRSVESLLRGEPSRALTALEPLLEHEPRFHLAHLVHGDILNALAGRPTPVSERSGKNAAVLAGLWSEAQRRWQFSTAPPGDLVPAVFVEIPASTRTVILVDTARSRLYRFANEGEALHLADHYYISIGRFGDGKTRAWDRRTPIGAYLIVDRLEDRELNERYGPLAFPVDYPNGWDRALGKNGDGIWLHGIERKTYSRPPRDSDGCIVLSNPDLFELAEHLELGVTPFVIGRNVQWLSPAHSTVRETLVEFAEGWRRAWQAGNADTFLGFYAPDYVPAGISRPEWDRARRRAFEAASVSAVTVSDLLIIAYPGETDTYLLRFRLELDSGDRRLETLKRLYLKRQPDGGFGIVATGNG